MKLIHTSDWHLGQQLYGYDRTEEHLHFFSHLKKAALEERPDALLVSGDIFDVSTPSAATSRMFTDFIVSLHNELPEMAIVITAGNHDSASRIDVDRNLWRSIGVHVIGKTIRNDGVYDFTDNIIVVDGKGVIAAVPFINRAFMTFENKEDVPEKLFFEKVGETAREKNTDSLPAVLMAHITVEGCDMTGHKTATIGNINSVSPEIFGDTFDYVALGHIHRAQNLKADASVRYSGTPVAVGFDENYPHSITVVELRKGEKPEVREIEIPQLRKMLTLPATGVDFKKALKMLSKLPGNDNSYVRLNVVQEQDLPADCEELAAELCREKDCRYCLIKYEKAGMKKAETGFEAMRAAEFSTFSPSEIARRFFTGMGLDEERMATYSSLLAEIEKEISEEQQE